MEEPDHKLPEEDRAKITPALGLKALEGSNQASSPSRGRLSSSATGGDAAGDKSLDSDALDPAEKGTGHFSLLDKDDKDDSSAAGKARSIATALAFPGLSKIKKISGLSKKKAAISLTTVILLLGGFFGFSILSGPFELIHYGQLLGKGAAHQEDSNNHRLSRDVRWLRTGDLGETRIGFVASKYVLPEVKADFAKQGIKLNTNKFGHFTTAEIDPAKSSKYSSMDSKTARATIAADNNLRPSQVSESKATSFKINLADLSVSDQKSFIKTRVKEQNLGPIASWIRVRVLSSYYEVPSWWHPIKKVSRDADKNLAGKLSTSKAGKEWLKKYNDRVANISPARQAKLDGFKDKLGAKGKLIGAALVASTAVCVAKDVAHNLPDINRAAVVVPAIQSGGDALALSSQGQSNQDFSLNQLGVLKQGLVASDGSTPWDSEPIRALNGGTGGTPADPEVKQAFSPDSDAANAEAAMDAAGAGVLCSTVGQLTQAAIGVALVASGAGGVVEKGVQLAVGAVVTGLVVNNLESIATNLLSDKPITGTPHQGAKGGAVDAYGTRELFNTENRTMGGTAVSSQTSAMLDAKQNLADKQQFASKSFAGRVFDVHDYRSLTSRIMDKQEPDAAQNFASLARNFTNLGSSFSGMLSVLIPRAHALTKPYDYGFPEVLIDQRLLSKADSAMVDDGIANGDVVAATILDNPTANDKYTEKAKTCFGVEIAKDDNNKWGAIPTEDVNPTSASYINAHCDDTSDKNWTRVRFFVWDTGLFEGVACFNGDEESCKHVGIGAGNSSQSTATSSTAGVTIDTKTLFNDSTSVACAANTKDLGIQDGYTKGTKVKIRICAVSNLPSTGEESNGGYGVSGADGKAVVNSRVSGAVFAMAEAAKKDGVSLSAGSSFRTMAHQQALCPCDGQSVAVPGTSNHQMGLAIDFAGGLPSSPGPISGNQFWDWLSKNADKFGYKNYPKEAWHWSPTGN